MMSPNRVQKLFLTLTIGFICIFLLAGGLIIFATRKTIPAPNQNDSTNIPTISNRPSVLPAPLKQNGESTLFYANPQQGYGFYYLASWRVDQHDTLSVATDPSRPYSYRPSYGFEKLLESDVLISSFPYASLTITPGATIVGTPTIQPHDQQLKDFALQFANNKLILPTTVNGLNAFIAETGGATYNIVVETAKNILLIQFPHKKSTAELSGGQSLILESIVEL